MTLYTPEKGGMIRKLCAQDIKEELKTPKIKVCPKQKIVYKLGKTQTMRRQFKKMKKSPRKWKLQTINPPKAKSLNIEIWSNNDDKDINFLNNGCDDHVIDYRDNNNNNNNNHCIQYQMMGLTSLEWTRHETDLLLTLCKDFNNRWSVIIDRYNLCKPQNRPKRRMTEIKERYYFCRNLIINKNKNKIKNKEKFNYDVMSEENRRNELSKLLRRSHDENIEISQTAIAYRKHEKLLKKKVNEMHKKRIQLEKQKVFILHRQQMTTQEIEQKKIDNISSNTNHDNNNYSSSHHLLPFGLYEGYGVIVQDTLLPRNQYNDNDDDILLPKQCIPKKITKIKRNIQMIDDEYTKYKYELKLDLTNNNKTTIVPFPYIDKSLIEQSKYDQSSSKKKKNKNNSNNNNQQQKNELLSSSNPNLGKEIAKTIQQQLVQENIVTICPYTAQPKMHPMTNTTRAMVNVLREDYIKYYALQTMINDLRKKLNNK